MPKKTLVAKTPDQVDDRLLSAAMEVFLDKGFAAASIDEIAARARASKLTFYNRYGNKEQLFEAVVNRRNAVVLELLSGTLPEGLPIDKLLGTVANKLYASLLEKETVALLRVLHAEAEHFPKLAAVFDKAGPARAAQLVATELKNRMESGELCKADPVLAAEHFLHLSFGEVMRRILLGVQPPLTKAEVQKRITSGVAVFLKAYAANK